MSTLRLAALSALLPKKREHIDAHVRQWFTDGYRTSVPGTNMCREDTDCEPGEICQGGYCAGLHRMYDVSGVFRGNEYRDLVRDIHFPLEDVSMYVLGHYPTLALPQPYNNRFASIENYRHKHGFSYKYDYSYA